MIEVRVREARADDLPFLWEMLLEAAYWLPGTPRPSLAELRSESHNSRYLAEWGREGDRALIAEVGKQPVGAAWFRLFSVDRAGYGFVDESTPEISIAVEQDHRGAGVGTQLLTALIEDAHRAGFAALSLSVAAPNPALRLYERLGFERLTLDSGSWTMRRDLRSAQR